jgi:hypothetical protein
LPKELFPLLLVPQESSPIAFVLIGYLGRAKEETFLKRELVIKMIKSIFKSKFPTLLIARLKGLKVVFRSEKGKLA